MQKKKKVINIPQKPGVLQLGSWIPLCWHWLAYTLRAWQRIGRYPPPTHRSYTQLSTKDCGGSCWWQAVKGPELLLRIPQWSVLLYNAVSSTVQTAQSRPPHCGPQPGSSSPDACQLLAKTTSELTTSPSRVWKSSLRMPLKFPQRPHVPFW